MKIIVTGASGFIGGALLPKLVDEGHEVVLLTRNPVQSRSTVDQRVRLEKWDGRTSGLWELQLEGTDAVINFAGEALDARRWTPRQKARIIGSRVDATSALVRSMAKTMRKPRVLINASGVGYYGAVTTGEVTEDSPRGSDFLSEVTFQWEKAAQGARAFGVRVAILRIAVVLGDNGGALRKMILPFKLFAGGRMGSGEQWFPWVHRDDLVGVILFVLGNRDLSGPVNVVAPDSVTMKQFCTRLGRALHRPSWVPVPGFVLKVALGEMSEMILNGQRAVPRLLERHGYKFKFPQLTAALSDVLR